jgi:hypothetical protein
MRIHYDPRPARIKMQDFGGNFAYKMQGLSDEAVRSSAVEGIQRVVFSMVFTYMYYIG